MGEFDAFFEELSSSEPVPGGGSVAALATAMASSLLVMVANLTIGRKRYQSVEEEARVIRQRAEALRDRARRLAAEDEAAYRAVSHAMGLPRETEDERTQRQYALQNALKSAVQPPLETMRAAAEVIELAGDLARIGNRNAISDVGCGSQLALAGYHGANLNVEINLAAVKDEAWVEAMRGTVGSMPHVEARDAETQRVVLAIIQGEAL